MGEFSPQVAVQMVRLSRCQMLHWVTIVLIVMGRRLVIKVKWLHDEGLDAIFLCGLLADLLIAVVEMLGTDNESKG